MATQYLQDKITQSSFDTETLDASKSCIDSIMISFAEQVKTNPDFFPGTRQR